MKTFANPKICVITGAGSGVGHDGRGGEIGGEAAVGRTEDSNLNAEEAEVPAEDTEIMHENEISKIIIGCAMKVQTRRERPMTLRTSAKTSEPSALK